ncbi:MAG: hypothetical protein KGH65_03845 [Candidatus Micrarchaeota archaeon]|nr:hypothetical protein [Candidatus Micrarchaeota archaeon]
MIPISMQVGQSGGNMTGSGLLPQATPLMGMQPSNYPMPSNVQMIPPQLQGGMYNQMAQLSAGPNYFMPRPQLGGYLPGAADIPGGSSSPVNTTGNNVTTMTGPPAGGLSTAIGGSGSIVGNGASNSPFVNPSPWQSNPFSPQNPGFNPPTGWSNLGGMAGGMAGGPLGGLLGGLFGGNSGGIAPTKMPADNTPMLQNPAIYFPGANLPNGTPIMGSNQGANLFTGPGGNLYNNYNYQVKLPNGDVVGALQPDGYQGPSFSGTHGLRR